MSLVHLPNDSCVICLDSLLGRTCIVIRPCGHSLHLDCSIMLATCPTCRGEIIREVQNDLVPPHVHEIERIIEVLPNDERTCQYEFTRGQYTGLLCGQVTPSDGIPYCSNCRRTRRKVRCIMEILNFNDFMHC